MANPVSIARLLVLARSIMENPAREPVVSEGVLLFLARWARTGR
jgi:hypothetical protein